MNWQLVRLGSLSLSLLLALGACTRDSDDDGLKNSREETLGTNPDVADSDHDGLKDGKEVRLGSDPLKADSDGDGLSDGDEVANGADPMVVDTDDDGYTDRDEVFEGHDPADPDDRIYQGNWPYYYGKTDLKGGSLDKRIETGKTIGHLIGKDWFGDDVDLWDFYNADKPVIIDVSAQWCPPCNAIAQWLHDDPNVAPSYDAEWPGLREAVENGDVYWITILEQQNSGEPAVLQTARQWHGLYPDDPIPVVSDHQEAMIDYLNLTYFPTIFVLNPNLKVDYVQTAPDPYGAALTHVVDDLLPNLPSAQ